MICAMAPAHTGLPEPRRWYFRCPVCEFDTKEAGMLATDSEIYCGMCAADNGKDVRLIRTLAPEPEEVTR